MRGTTQAGKTIVRVLAYILVITGILLIVIPFLWMILTSLKTQHQVYQLPPRFIPKPFDLTGYVQTFTLWNVPRYFFNSLVVSGGVTLGSGFICTLAGYAFAKLKFPFKNALFYYVLASLMLPFQVRMITTFLLLKQLSMLNNYAGLIVPWLATGFGVFLMRQMVAAMPASLIDAARIDGCSEFGIFTRIVAPNVTQGIYAFSVITFVQMWNNLLWPLVVVTGSRLKMLPQLLASLGAGPVATTSSPWPTAMAAVTVVLMPVLIVFIVFQRHIIRAMAVTSGIK